MANLIDFPLGLSPGETRLDIDPETVLHAAIGRLKDVVIVGYETSGDFYFASSSSGGPETLWLLALAQKKLLDIGEGT